MDEELTWTLDGPGARKPQAEFREIDLRDLEQISAFIREVEINI